MMKLQHVSEVDGWAIVVDNDRFLLVSPPYKIENIDQLDNDQVYNIIKSGNFVTENLIFDSFSQLKSHLDETVRKKRSQYAPLLDDRSIAAKALEAASEEDLLRFLNKIDNDLIKQSSADRAEGLIIQIISLNSDSITKEVRSRAAGLLTAIKNERMSEPVSAVNPVDISKKYPRSTARYGKEALLLLAERLSQRRSIFAFAPS
ncbi:hypothetical protein ABZT49_17715 [Methylobacterium sp. EM32]|uniref:hypothetical protein n=1 Tax=Methylobacterium sp. EM32 TaxID=3163481 RepID=UPI0033B0080E